eukprot:GILJ01022698.1.p1 GENE.GILJ01022698.1~~GILJ01022698.1.p1  ORF type:complete len:110 (-),score=9.86 GILJ01022698.1:93-422(-)
MSVMRRLFASCLPCRKKKKPIAELSPTDTKSGESSKGSAVDVCISLEHASKHQNPHGMTPITPMDPRFRKRHREDETVVCASADFINRLEDALQRNEAKRSSLEIVVSC